jgi:hypothetical protein
MKSGEQTDGYPKPDLFLDSKASRSFTVAVLSNTHTTVVPTAMIPAL